MSVIQWSTPERRIGCRNLPIIPNEIYLTIFEHIAPTSTKLSPEQLKTFSKLSRICRLFCNVCLPRIFEYLEFSGSIFDTLPAQAARMASRAWILCQQIAAKQPLALSLAQYVKVCRFTDFLDAGAGSWGVQMFSKLYISSMAHMKNIRKLYFLQSSVENEHWDVITNLGSLQELSFTLCNFVDGFADVDHGKRLKVKVPCLRIIMCSGVSQLTAAIDARHLRTLTIDPTFSADQFDWLSEIVITELCIHDAYMQGSHRNVKHILNKMPQSIQVLTLPVYARAEIELFGDPMWKNIPLLRSLTLEEVVGFPGKASMTTARMICEGIRVHRGLQSFTLKTGWASRLHSPAEVRRMIDEQLNDIPGLNFVDIYGVAVHLVDGKWINVQDGDSVI